MTEEEYAAEVTPWEPLGECEPSIPPAWPTSSPPLPTTAAPGHSLGRAPGGEGEGEGEEEEEVQVISSPGQLFPSSGSASHYQHQLPPKAAAGGPLQPSSSTNTLLPALSGPNSPFSSHEGAATRGPRAQSHPVNPAPPMLQQQGSGSGSGFGSSSGGGREHRAFSHQPVAASASSSSLVGLAGAGIGSSAAPSPFSSARSGAIGLGLGLAPSSSSASLAGAGAGGVEEKKEGGPQLPSPPPAGAAGTTLADFDYEVRALGRRC